MAIDFERVEQLKGQLYYELSLAAHLVLSNGRDSAIEVAMGRAIGFREMLKTATSMDKIAGTA